LNSTFDLFLSYDKAHFHLDGQLNWNSHNFIYNVFWGWEKPTDEARGVGLLEAHTLKKVTAWYLSNPSIIWGCDFVKNYKNEKFQQSSFWISLWIREI
jgi:hypothetical protein